MHPLLLAALAATASILIEVTPTSPGISRLELTVTGLGVQDTRDILEQTLRDLDAELEPGPTAVPDGETRG